MNTKVKPYKMAAIIRMAIDKVLGIFSPINILVRTPKQIKERVINWDFFIKSILEKGKYL